MADVDRERWDARHAAAGATGDPVPMPPDALRGREHLLPAGGRALDVACGRGGVAVWLAGRGFTVDAVDISGSALAAAEDLALRHGVGDRVHRWHHDLDAGLPAACTGPYTVVVCQRFRDPQRYPDLVARLASGGLLAVTVLSEVDDGPGAYRAPPGELLRAFDGLEVIHYVERDGEATLLARAAATGLPAAAAQVASARDQPTPRFSGDC